MVHDLLFYELLLAGLLWLGMHTYVRWHCGHATKSPPAQRPKRLPPAPEPFAGLTYQPHCSACEQGQEPGDQPRPSPLPFCTPKRGRPRTVDTHIHM